jgi:hypothetical protein
MKNYNISPRLPFTSSVLSIFLFLFLVSGLIAQTPVKAKGPKNFITTDLIGVLSEDSREYALTYERKISEKTSLMATVGYLGNQDPGEIKKGYTEQRYTRKVASGWYDYYLLYGLIHISGSYTDRTTYYGNYPWSLPKQTKFLTSAVYVRGGYKFFKINKPKTNGRSTWYNKRKTNQRSPWYIMPELFLAVQKYNEYDINISEEVLGTESGSYELPDEAESWTTWDIRQSRDIQKKESTQWVIGALATVGYQQLLFKRVIIGLQATVGGLLPMKNEDLYLGRDTKKNFYGRFTMMTGFAF